MMNQNQDFTTGSIPKKYIRFIIPILGALILQAMYSAVDLLIVGRFGTTAGISGVSTGSGIMNMVTFITCALTVGVTVLMGQFLGENKPENIGPLIGNSTFFYIILSLIVTVLLEVAARPIAVLMQAPPEALDLTVTYIRICGAGFIFIVFYNYLAAIFRGLGDSNMPLLFVGIACVCNIIGDYVLVAVFHMNVAGAALATVGAQAVSVILSLVIILKKEKRFTIKRQDFFWGPYIKPFVQIGFPLALQELLTNLTFLAICAFVNRLGLDASSGYGIAYKITSFILLIPISILQSMASFVAQNVGAKKEDRARSAMFFGMALGVGTGLIIAVLTFLYGDYIAAVFTSDRNVIMHAFDYFKGFAPEAFITGILFSFMGYFNGHGRSLFVMLQSLAQSLVVRLPMSYIMSIQPNTSLFKIALATPTATLFGIIICFVYYMKTKKEFLKD